MYLPSETVDYKFQFKKIENIYKTHDEKNFQIIKNLRDQILEK